MRPNQPWLPTHMPSLDSPRQHPPFGHEAALLVSCIRCRRLHSAAQPFAFNPVCPACSGPIRSIDA